jgi:transposase
MGRVTKAVGHLSEDEIKERIRAAKTTWISQKWLVILHATVNPKPAREIALHVGVEKGTVHNLISNYNRFDPPVVGCVGRGGRRNSHLTREEEAEFIAPFVDLARKGQIVVGAQIGKVLEERVGRPLHHSIIYRLLDRNGWRKVVPRPFHVDSRKEAQEDFKKNSRRR